MSLKNHLKHHPRTSKIYAKISNFSKKINSKKLEMLFALFSLLPVNSRKVVFGYSHMRDNLDELWRLCKDAGFKTRGVISNDFYTGQNLAKNVYHLATAKFVLIDTHFAYFYRIKMREKTCVIQVWHASGIFKKFGLLGEKLGFESQWYKDCLRECAEYDYCIVSGAKAVQGYCDAFNMKASQMLLFGNVKMDKFIRTKVEQNEAKRTLGVDENKKLILYAPTFRDTNWAQKDNFKLNFNFDKFFAKFGDKYELAVRLHTSMSDFEVKNLHPKVHNFSQKSEVLVLSAADAMVADYSSIIFSFSHFEKPMYFYAFDLDEYIAQRDFYVDYEKFVPGNIARDFDTLLKYLENIPEFSPRARQLRLDYMEFVDGKTSQKVVEFMKNLR